MCNQYFMNLVKTVSWDLLKHHTRETRLFHVYMSLDMDSSALHKYF